MAETVKIPGFRRVPETGVIFVTKQAAERGFYYGNSKWANLGQGSPEVGDLPGAPPRITSLHIDPSAHAYSSVAGRLHLRQKVADYYNALYRSDKASKYTYENVGIAGGGRVALSRVASALGNINIGHFLPDYTAYEELLGVFKAFTPIPILLEAESDYLISLDALEREVLGRGLRAVLLSNPCNPTGQVIQGEALERWVQLARHLEVTVIFDEFYSHYLYPQEGEPFGRALSAASFVEDVNQDPILILDGLTKNWRYPGWRVCWTLGPKSVIEAISSAGSFLDGGANHPLQQEAAQLLEPTHAFQETCATQRHFFQKRQYLLEEVAQLGIKVTCEPRGGFYLWADLSDLPPPLNDGLSFFERGLKEHLITVPGIFFDVNPARRRCVRRYQNFCRMSFGPEVAELQRGVAAMKRLLATV